MGKIPRKIIFLLVVAAVLRLVNLNQSFWLDEGAQMVMARESLAFQWVGRSADFHPPLFYFLMHFWLELGTSEWFLRLPSVFFGVATVLLVYHLAQKLFNQRIAFWASLFLAFNPYHIYYSQEARMYSLLVFLATLSTYFFWKKKYLFYLLTTTVLLYTHYSAFFVLLFHLIWFILDIAYFSPIADKYATLRSVLARWILVFGMIFLLYLPWIPQFLKQFSAGNFLVDILPGWREVANLSFWKAVPLTFFKFSLGRISFENKVFYFFVILILFLVLGFLFWQAIRKINKGKIFILNWFLAPILIVWLVSFVTPMFQPFRLLFTIVPFYILLVVGISELKEGILQKAAYGMIILINLAGLGMYYADPKFQREDWRSATKFIESQDEKKSVALFEFSAPFAPYQWYTQGKVEARGVLPGLRATSEIVEQEMEEATSGKEQIFLFQYLRELTDPQKQVEKWLITHDYQQSRVYDFSGVGFVYNYYKQSLLLRNKQSL